MASLIKSIVAGATAGLVASYVMDQFQAVMSAASTANTTGKKETGHTDDATVKAAAAISSALFDYELSPAEKTWAGPAVHYGLGATLGAIFGALEPNVPMVGAGAGTLYGSAVWLGADEIAVPAVGLSGPATETPLSGHLNALASHVVFGVVTSAVRDILLR